MQDNDGNLTEFGGWIWCLIAGVAFGALGLAVSWAENLK